MIVHRQGDLLSSRASALVNPVNCFGAMGKGIAAEFKRVFPLMFEDYASRCSQNQVKPGVPYAFQETVNGTWIINFPTKNHWRGQSQLGWIASGLASLPDVLFAIGVKDLALPRLGCGEGGLNWKDVGPLVERELGPLDMKVEIWTRGASSRMEQEPTLF